MRLPRILLPVVSITDLIQPLKEPSEETQPWSLGQAGGKPRKGQRNAVELSEFAERF